MTQCVSVYSAKVAVGHVASFDPGASQMQMSVAIGPYGSYDPVETPKPLWGSPGAELSTWTTFLKPLYTDTHCVTALHSYTAIQRYTALYTIQLYSAIHYTTSTTPLWWADGPSRQNCQNTRSAIYFEAAKCAKPPKVPKFSRRRCLK